MYRSRRSKRRWIVFVINLIMAVLCVFIALRIEPIGRRVQAIPYYARTYINKLRPKPELPPPPAVSAVDPATLLQTRTEIASTASQQADTPAYFEEVLGLIGSNSGESPKQLEVRLVESTTTQVAPVASQVALGGFNHEWQTWNNCGPVTIAMNLSYFGHAETQVEAAQFLKPNQDDKNVNPEELAAYAQTLGFETFLGAGGNVEFLKLLLSNELPVIVETWLDPGDNGGLGHYRLFTGYDQAGNYFTAQDSLHGTDLKVPIAEFDTFWQVFNRKYILIYRPEQSGLVHAILNLQAIEEIMFEQALLTAQQEAKANPGNAFAWFNIGTNYAHLDEPELAASAFDEARRLGLPFRMLWYQFDIFETYLAVGRYQEVIDLATATLKATGGLEEIYYYRGLAWQATNQPEAAVDDFRAALEYNSNFDVAAMALEKLEPSS